MKQAPLGKYSVNYNNEDLVEICKKNWLLIWIAQNHPEVIEKAERMARELLKEAEQEEETKQEDG